MKKITILASLIAILMMGCFNKKYMAFEKSPILKITQKCLNVPTENQLIDLDTTLQNTWVFAIDKIKSSNVKIDSKCENELVIRLERKIVGIDTLFRVYYTIKINGKTAYDSIHRHNITLYNGEINDLIKQSVKALTELMIKENNL